MAGTVTVDVGCVVAVEQLHLHWPLMLCCTYIVAVVRNHRGCKNFCTDL